MSTPRVYADFNGLEFVNAECSLAVLNLTGYGTLASLSKQKLRLSEGLALVLYEPNDIEADATAHFDRARKDPAGRAGAWVARIDPQKIRDCTQGESIFSEHLCYGCGTDLKPYLRRVGQQYTETCPNCGTSIMAPLAPPPNAT